MSQGLKQEFEDNIKKFFPGAFKDIDRDKYRRTVMDIFWDFNDVKTVGGDFHCILNMNDFIGLTSTRFKFYMLFHYSEVKKGDLAKDYKKVLGSWEEMRRHVTRNEVFNESEIFSFYNQFDCADRLTKFDVNLMLRHEPEKINRHPLKCIGSVFFMYSKFGFYEMQLAWLKKFFPEESYTNLIVNTQNIIIKMDQVIEDLEEEISYYVKNLDESEFLKVVDFCALLLGSIDSENISKYTLGIKNFLRILFPSFNERGIKLSSKVILSDRSQEIYNLSRDIENFLEIKSIVRVK